MDSLYKLIVMNRFEVERLWVFLKFFFQNKGSKLEIVRKCRIKFDHETDFIIDTLEAVTENVRKNLSTSIRHHSKNYAFHASD